MPFAVHARVCRLLTARTSLAFVVGADFEGVTALSHLARDAPPPSRVIHEVWETADVNQERSSPWAK